jgi:hypothetical protein
LGVESDSFRTGEPRGRGWPIVSAEANTTARDCGRNSGRSDLVDCGKPIGGIDITRRIYLEIQGINRGEEIDRAGAIDLSNSMAVPISDINVPCGIHRHCPWEVKQCGAGWSSISQRLYARQSLDRVRISLAGSGRSKKQGEEPSESKIAHAGECSDTVSPSDLTRQEVFAKKTILRR